MRIYKKTQTTASTNTIEGFYSIFKRGMKGVYQHCSEKHLHRYLAEFDFSYSNRSARGVEDGDVRRRPSRVSRAGVSRIAYLTMTPRRK
jgi:ISXO2-like transposase domain